MRKIKWVGEPAYTYEDGFGVADWEKENKRSVASVRFAVLRAKPENIPGLSREYVWGLPRVKGKDGRFKWGKAARATWEDFIQEVDDLDWDILQRQEWFAKQVKDVTGHPNPVEVTKDKIFVRLNPRTGQYVRVLNRS